MGTVKRCVSLSSGTTYAVKIIKTRDDEIIGNAKKEFERLKKIDHVNIIAVHELLIDNLVGNVYLVMEFFKGKEMFQLLTEIGCYDGGLNREYVARAIFADIRGNQISAQAGHSAQGPQAK